MQQEIDDILENLPQENIINELENMYDGYNSILHDEHYIMQIIRFNLILLYGCAFECDISQDDCNILERKVDFCDCLLKVNFLNFFVLLLYYNIFLSLAFISN